MRCSTCGLNLPTTFTHCPACEGVLWLDPNEEPEEWWQWRATSILQSGEESILLGVQPYYLKLPIIKVIDVSGPEPTTFPAIDLIAVHEYRGRQLLLKGGDVVELPNPDWTDEGNQPLTLLYEMIGTYRGEQGKGTRYVLRPLRIPEAVPDEWVEEFARGED
jgi:hypothetical protein